MSKKNKLNIDKQIKPKRKFHFPLEGKTIEAENYAEALKILKGNK